ncbi:MAG: TetR/AcrR family transcriptional regulator [Erysipelotrichaceae bacterium]|nr:TetR/AcrR family transcriptional regulator [Erysipelotrichaceae bacterium]
MKEKRTDKRTVMTKHRIEQAIMDDWIAGNTPSVKEITEKLQLNRNTFYIHYANIEDATTSMFHGFTKEILDRIDTKTYQDWTNDPQWVTSVIVDVLYQDEKTKQMAFMTKLSSQYMIDMTTEIVDHIYEEYSRNGINRPTMYLAINFLISGFVHSLYTITRNHPEMADANTLMNHIGPMVRKGFSEK